jgi:hypothetical protein
MFSNWRLFSLKTFTNHQSARTIKLSKVKEDSICQDVLRKNASQVDRVFLNVPLIASAKVQKFMLSMKMSASTVARVKWCAQ